MLALIYGMKERTKKLSKSGNEMYDESLFRIFFERTLPYMRISNIYDVIRKIRWMTF